VCGRGGAAGGTTGSWWRRWREGVGGLGLGEGRGGADYIAVLGRLVNGPQGGGSWVGGLCREAASLALGTESSLPRVKLSAQAISLKFNSKNSKMV
jgi:hypothetical protein